MKDILSLLPVAGAVLVCGLALSPAAGMAQGAGAPAVTRPPPALDRPVRPGMAPIPLEGDPMPAAEERAASPAAGDPGRQSIPPAAPVPPAAAPDWAWRSVEIAEAFECPMSAIAKMLEAAQGKSEFSPAMELEREVLVLCRDRWEVLKKMMDAELSLVAVLREDRAVREREAIALEEMRQIARARIEGARQAAIEVAREAAARKLVEAAPKPAAAAPEPKAVTTPAPEERYRWFAMMGSGSDLRAAVTDGAGRWWVRVGDSLPGGVRIEAIRARPPRVIVKGGPSTGLAYRPGGR